MGYGVRSQAEFIRRQQLGRSYSSKDIFCSKLVCDGCGGFYGQKVGIQIASIEESSGNVIISLMIK